MNIKNVIVGIMSVVTITGFANASYIDFTTDEFSSADGSGEASFTGVGETGNIDLTLTAFEPADATLTHTGEGIGINTPWFFDDPNAVDANEILVVDFDNGPVHISELTFNEFDENYFLWFDEMIVYNTNGQYSFDLSTLFSTDSYIIANGQSSFSMDLDNVTGIGFRAVPLTGSSFTLAGIDVTAESVPEPRVMSLLSFGLISLFFVRRKNESA